MSVVKLKKIYIPYIIEEKYKGKVSVRFFLNKFRPLGLFFNICISRLKLELLAGFKEQRV
jgi:hypothetical protein